MVFSKSSPEASISAYEALLDTLAFTHLSDTPNTTPRVFSVAVSDGELSSTVATATISVTTTNDAPEVLNLATQAEYDWGRDVPTTQADAKAMLDEVRTRGISRVTDTLLPGVVGFCAPVFDSDGHLALGMLSLGPASSFDAAWDGKAAKALKQAAQQLSSELGHRAH